MILRRVTVFILAIFLAFGAAVGVLADEISGWEHFQSFLDDHFPGVEAETAWQSICEIVISENPELADFLELKEVRSLQNNNAVFMYLVEGALELIRIPFSETENQLLAHSHFYLEPDWAREWWVFSDLLLRWDSARGFFVKIPISDPVSYNEYLGVRFIELDSETTVLAITGRSGPAGRIGDLDLFLYRNGQYDRIYHSPSAYAQILVDDQGDVTVTDLNWGSWNEFPINTFFLDMTTLSYTWQSRSHFVWDSHQREFILTKETPSNFAVVNSFLKAIVDGETKKAISFVDSKYAESISFLEIWAQLESFASEQHLTLAMSSPLDLESSYVSVGSMIESDWVDPSYTNVKWIVRFELSQSDFPKIVDIEVIILPPREWRPSVKQHVRPTMDFDRKAFEEYADFFGWENIYSRVASKITVESSEESGEWLHLGATLRTPALLWAESHYAAELRFESAESAVLNYENLVDPFTVPISVEMASLNKLALNEDSLRFVLSTDTGKRWEGEFSTEPLRSVAFLGIDVSSRVIHVEFDTREDPIDWDLVQSLTLHVIRLDKLERADLSWDFGRLP